MLAQEKPNNITSISKMAPRRLSMHHGSSKAFFYSIPKGCCKYLQQALHKSKSKWEKERRVERSGRDLSIVTVH
jgi:hypothetical protein